MGSGSRGSREIVVARAPGRLDVMGGIADYSGSLVLELPLGVATSAAVQALDDSAIVVRSHDTVRVALDELQAGGEWIDYWRAREVLSENPRTRWVAYVIGTLVVLGRERGLRISGGLRIDIDSSVPAGKGVASSAAIEVATMRAVCGFYDIEIEGRDLAILCQMAENVVVGAPCGVMDQMTSACGEEHRLLALVCQPAQIVGQVVIPTELELWGIDSGIRHEIGAGADYGAVRVGAFMGYRIVAAHAGLDVRERGDGHVDVDDPRWRGYLANVSPSRWRRDFRDRVPVQISGAEFLAAYGGITDLVTRVDPSKTYAVRQPTEHPIREHARVHEFKLILESGATSETDRQRLGALMFESHESYSACGLGSSGTDRLVDMVRARGGDLYGAKITGGGSGGTVAVLARAGSRAAIERIAAEYAAEAGHAATVLGGSSPGAMRFGVHRQTPGRVF